MFGLTSLQLKFVVALAAMVMMAGSFGAGLFYGGQRKEVKYEKAALNDFKVRVDTAMKIADGFAALQIEVGKKVTEIRQTAVTTAQKGKTYVAQHPTTTPNVLPDFVVELRRCQIDAIYKDAGYPVPRERNGVTCPPALPVEQSSGPDRH